MSKVSALSTMVPAVSLTLQTLTPEVCFGRIHAHWERKNDRFQACAAPDKPRCTTEDRLGVYATTRTCHHIRCSCDLQSITGGQASNMAYQPYATEPEVVSMKAACANIPQLPSP